MCGRFASSTEPAELVRLFGVEQWDPTETIAPSWNVAPTARTYAVLDRAPRGQRRPVRQLHTLRWGLVPGWASSPETAVKMINARAETVHEKPAYRQAYASRRCLIPVDGYYEWQTAPTDDVSRPPRRPYFVHRADGAPLALAGLYEFWRDRERPGDHPDAWLVTCTVVTTAAEPLLAPVHERMPLYLGPDRWDAWLDPHAETADLTPPPPGDLRIHAVPDEVGRIRNNHPGLTRPLTEDDLTTLF
ncbi:MULTISPECIES: SOS response-associated peptidase [Kitasatospora]|uniref:SOS response-associated peptidase n=1 Tax=Kitasatospora TaxID=2063 RepID=UPI0022848B65|nr:SOS response-associated peptidase [Kitasatospora sp. YST-16]WAL73771.1 SOS response-associated peptidase [Kitasatospora sp. YST-16]WNW39842.1 SOS response-associated peptidase [Streptomyces sp. Li-HN-5-13]